MRRDLELETEEFDADQFELPKNGVVITLEGAENGLSIVTIGNPGPSERHMAETIYRLITSTSANPSKMATVVTRGLAVCDMSLH